MSAVLIGQPEIVFSTPANTNLTTVYTNDTGYIAYLQFANIVALIAGTVTVIINDGSTDHKIIAGTSLALAGHELVEWRDGFPLPNGYIIKVQSGTSSCATYALSINQTFRAT